MIMKSIISGGCDRYLPQYLASALRITMISVLPVLCLLAILQPSIQKDIYHQSLRQTQRKTLSPKNAAEKLPSYWNEEARRGIEERLRRGDGESGVPAVRNVVMFLGDGMSGSTLAAARALLGQRRGATGEEAHLFFEQFPTVGMAKTYCVDAQVADSACTATAYLCGVKNNLGTIGVTANVSRFHCGDLPSDVLVDSIAAWALEDGRDAGIVTTTRVTHASPAGAYAHIADRDWESDADVEPACPDASEQPADIAFQLVHSYPGNHFKVILGGGRREFLPKTFIDEEGTSGRRLDGRNLIEDWKNDKLARNVSHSYVWNREQLMRLSLSPPEYLLGLFEDTHMRYNLLTDAETEPTLAEMTEIALRSLSRNKKGFFLFVEGGRIDHAHHDNQVQLALDETIQLSEAVKRAADLLSPEDSLVVVTADHSHAMAFSGYTHRGGDILGPSDDVGDDAVPYMTLSYANGPGARTHIDGKRVDVTKESDFGSTSWLSPAEVPLESETHGGEDVAVFARGPQRRLFSGLYEQSQLPHLMAFAGCFGHGPHACDPH